MAFFPTLSAFELGLITFSIGYVGISTFFVGSIAARVLVSQILTERVRSRRVVHGKISIQDALAQANTLILARKTDGEIFRCFDDLFFEYMINPHVFERVLKTIRPSFYRNLILEFNDTLATLASWSTNPMSMRQRLANINEGYRIRNLLGIGLSVTGTHSRDCLRIVQRVIEGARNNYNDEDSS